MPNLDDNVHYADKINELVQSNNELLAEVQRLRDIIYDIAGESLLRVVFAMHIRRKFPQLRKAIKPMDVPPVLPERVVVPFSVAGLEICEERAFPHSRKVVK